MTSAPSSYRRLLAIDPSLTCSGWALFEVKGSVLRSFGKMKPLGTTFSLSRRLSDLQERVNSLIVTLELGQGDLLVCEGPTTMKDPQAVIKVEQVRSIFEGVARTHKIHVPGRINPRTVHHELLGMYGAQLARPLVKAQAVRTVRTLYGSVLEAVGLDTSEKSLSRHQDIIDAMLLGTVAVQRAVFAQTSGVGIDGIL
jgi:Holliday junction resolvasome RuvABC endonuclease subunit